MSALGRLSRRARGGLVPDPSAQQAHGTGLRGDPNAPQMRKDPAPSRWAWRLERLMLTPAFLLTLRVGLPFGLCLMAGLWWLSDEARVQAMMDSVAEARASIEERPEFVVSLMAIDGAPDELSAAIRDTLPIDFPTSSFDLDLPALRQTILDLPPVHDVALRVRPGGVLHVAITPRVPVAIWRTPEGLLMIDETGAFVAQLPRRQLRPDLPIIAGPGADAAVDEGLRLHAVAAASLGPRLRGLVRMGARRWDVVLDDGLRILLPEFGALPALRRVLALEDSDGLLGLDVARVDMRIGARPTVQMNEFATTTWRTRFQEQGSP